ncbi:hypothetical protein [Leptolyngbya sp. FACHB-16]|uniref:hypothetical protein n=1 Tax=unclassified Leptolyngbya TaxID=2650499 RepID=UPI00168701E2|nr:hypothetical protein [Leptolyngbya sp. FACHB-16]MBD2158679.1 hypothetical protein [Leptolyngbya sp. FACHB-16]
MNEKPIVDVRRFPEKNFPIFWKKGAAKPRLFSKKWGYCFPEISLVCEFDENTSRAGVRRLEIRYQVDDETWKELTQQARMVFQGEPYFNLAP